MEDIPIADYIEGRIAEAVAAELEKYALLVKEVERLRSAISRIDSINDNPAVYNPEINDVCDTILRPHLIKD